MSIPLLEGRDFSPQDERGTAPVAIVNQSFQKRFFGSGPVLGRKIHAEGQVFAIIGLVRDSKYRRLTEGSTPCFYIASRQFLNDDFWTAFFVRTNRPLGNMLGVLGREAAAINPATRGSAFLPYENWLEAALYTQRAAALLVGAVGLVSLLLSAIGLYSVLTFALKQRTHEFGIRLALGGSSWQVISTMLRQGMALTLAGLASGLVLSAVLLKFASTILPTERSGGAEVFASAMVLLSLVAFLASYLPGRRAAQLDPMTALRDE